MISEVKTCIQCGEELQIFHLAQRQKKYCSYKCSDSFTHKECLSKENSSSSWIYAWYSDITCEEFCDELVDGEPSNMDCVIDNDF